MTAPENDPHKSWPWLNWSIVLVFVAAILLIGLISAGVFDPKPLGSHIQTLSLEPVNLGGGQSHLGWLTSSPPATSHTLRLTAALGQGELDSAYGLVIGDDGQSMVVAVSPAGYVAIWRNQGQERQMIMPWRTWPHVALEQQPNELWLDLEGNTLTAVRINRELLWEGEQPAAGGRIGLWAESFGGTARIDFLSLEQFSESPAD